MITEAEVLQWFRAAFQTYFSSKTCFATRAAAWRTSLVLSFSLELGRFLRSYSTTPCCSSVVGRLTIVFQRISVESEVASTFPSFRFPELSQPI
jgi:hypothetical protein